MKPKKNRTHSICDNCLYRYLDDYGNYKCEKNGRRTYWNKQECPDHIESAKSYWQNQEDKP